MSKLRQVLKYLMSFQLLNNPEDYDYYLRDLNYYKKENNNLSPLDAIYNDISKVNNDFYNVLNKKSS